MGSLKLLPMMVLDRKIAFIDLTSGSVRTEDIPIDLRRKFVGGRGLNMYLLSQHYSRELDPFSSENPLIFGQVPWVLDHA
jgi:aldehyde:ferredoxin oxidoreductase